jgi:hypothetical protein
MDNQVNTRSNALNITLNVVVVRNFLDSIRSLIFLVIWLPGLASAEQIIRLQDGSEIRGEVVSFSSGVYTIDTRSLGIIKLAGDQVRMMTSGGAPANEPLAEVREQMDAQTVQSIQSTIAANTGLMTTIFRLQNDPAMKAVLSDPEVMRAVQNLDLQALADHPKIKALMTSPEVQRIQNQLQ